MSNAALKLCIPQPGQSWNTSQMMAVNPCLERMSAPDRVQWSLDFLPRQHVLTSSFGAQSAVLLHMLNRFEPKIPVVLIDTGYLFPETYRFIDQMVERLDLDLRVYRPVMSPACRSAEDQSGVPDSVDLRIAATRRCQCDGLVESRSQFSHCNVLGRTNRGDTGSPGQFSYTDRRSTPARIREPHGSSGNLPIESGR